MSFRPILTKVTILLSGFALALSSLFAFLPAEVGASYNPEFLISDSIFRDYGSMSSLDIQNFLASKNSGLTNYHDTEDCGSNSGTHYAFYATYYSCGQSASASKIIYDAAQAYGISPKIILATLQKEQSLVTTPNPTSSQLNCAMGYNSCSGFSGFFNQVDSGTWQFRTDFELSSGNNWWGYTPSSYPCKNATHLYSTGLYANRTVTFYSDSGNAYKTITLANPSTASLYCYTPYVGPYSETGYSGSYNFVVSFEQWFGSTQNGSLFIAHPDGTLVRPAAGPNASHVYLLKDGTAAYATSLAVFQSWEFDFGRVKIATQGDLNLMAAADANPTGNSTPLQFREGTLVKGSAPTVYVIQNVSGVNHKRSLDSLENFIRLGYSFSDVINIPDSELTPIPTDPPLTITFPLHPNGTMVRNPGEATVYYVIDGGRRSMTSGSIFASHRFKWSDVKKSTPADDQLSTLAPVTWFGEGTLLKGSAPTVYIVDLDTSGVHQSIRNFVTYYNFVGLDYHFSEVMLVSDSELQIASGPDIGQ